MLQIAMDKQYLQVLIIKGLVTTIIIAHNKELSVPLIDTTSTNTT